MSWKKPTDPDILNKQSAGCAVEHLGIVFVPSESPDTITATMPVDHRTRQPFGLLHGGASVLLAETVGSVAGNLCVSDDQYCVGQSIQANHIRGITEGTVIATARARHLGRTTQVWQIDIEDTKQRLICSVSLTLAVLTRR